MVTLLISIALLIVGYVFYGKFVEKVFGPDPNRPTPAIAQADGIDNIAMPPWKVFMIQFLNIDGTGSIFGAIMGAMFGPSCYLWIVFGCIFAGAVHDYMIGMLSVRHDGANLPELVRIYLGKNTSRLMVVFSLVLLILVGSVFVYSPSLILGGLTGAAVQGGVRQATLLWVGVIFIYYFFASIIPIDKIIGRFYPFFAGTIAFMGVALLVCLFVRMPDSVPEIWDGLQNRNPSAGRVFPCIFITLACGALSGFHGTQSPLMARCLPNEKYGRPVFYGSMVLEGVSALIWATVSSYFFYGGGAEAMNAAGVTDAPQVVTTVCKSWLGKFGGLLAIIGVVMAPITSGDTALRSARLIVKNAFNLKGTTTRDILTIAIPIFIVSGGLIILNILDAQGFDVIWRYFGWANQTLAAFSLWTVTAYLVRHKHGFEYLISMIPAAFITSASLTFILTAKIGFNLPESMTLYIGSVVFVAAVAIFYILKSRLRKV